MAKLKSDPIRTADIEEYIAGHSDFAFELQVLKRLRKLNFECEHGGTYRDPVTGKFRQFDIRACRVYSQGACLRLAVECKHIGAHFPLVVVRVPRDLYETEHHVLWSWNRETYQIINGMRDDGSGSMIRSVQGADSIYKQEKPVGKSCDQVGRLESGAVRTTDRDTFDKWMQAVSSGYAMVQSAKRDCMRTGCGYAGTIIIPVLVLPDERLWVVDYDHEGNVTGEPKQVTRCSLFLQSQLAESMYRRPDQYHFTHLEFVTMQGLDEIVRIFDPEHYRRMYFDFDQLGGTIGPRK